MKIILIFFVLLAFAECNGPNKKQEGAIVNNHRTEILENSVEMEVPILEAPKKENDYWDKFLKEELYSSLINVSDSIYISDRKQFEAIEGAKCVNSVATFKYLTKALDSIEIRIEKVFFDPNKHKLNIKDTVSHIVNGMNQLYYILSNDEIDGKYSYGIDGNIPRTQFRTLDIKWNGKSLSVPDTAYSDLYEPNFCLEYKTYEAYLTNTKHIYLYMNCSDGAGAYSVKFVFDTSRYLTRIISRNEMTNGFDFIDGIAKVE